MPRIAALLSPSLVSPASSIWSLPFLLYRVSITSPCNSLNNGTSWVLSSKSNPKESRRLDTVSFWPDDAMICNVSCAESLILCLCWIPLCWIIWITLPSITQRKSIYIDLLWFTKDVSNSCSLPKCLHCGLLGTSSKQSWKDISRERWLNDADRIW